MLKKPNIAAGSAIASGYTKVDSPHLTEPEVRQKLEEIEQSEGQAKRDLMTELAWRPAWAIRSRRGTWGVLKGMFKGGITKQSD